jgi:hypothetical protein
VGRPRAGLDTVEKRKISRPCGESNPGRPARSYTDWAMSNLCLVLPSNSVPSDIPTKIVYEFLTFPCMLHTPPSHLLLFHSRNSICWREKLWNFWLINSIASCYIWSFLGPISSSAPCSQTPSVYVLHLWINGSTLWTSSHAPLLPRSTVGSVEFPPSTMNREILYIKAS